VALKDFIVGFLGWFVLMGKNGIRLGDWVEINGVTGEVVELGMFHTVLLETGNWTDSGHPTGRRVTFTNSYAIEGHYFNFSTSGQWMWDELQVVLPTGQDHIPSSMRFRKRSPKQPPKPRNRRAGVEKRGAFAAGEHSIGCACHQRETGHRRCRDRRALHHQRQRALPVARQALSSGRGSSRREGCCSASGPCTHASSIHAPSN